MLILNYPIPINVKEVGAYSFYLFFFKDFIYLLLERGKGERERETAIGCLLRPQLGTWPATQACALTGNHTGDLSVCRWALSPLSHTSPGYSFYFLSNSRYSSSVLSPTSLIYHQRISCHPLIYFPSILIYKISGKTAIFLDTFSTEILLPSNCHQFGSGKLIKILYRFERFLHWHSLQLHLNIPLYFPTFLFSWWLMDMAHLLSPKEIQLDGLLGSIKIQLPAVNTHTHTHTIPCPRNKRKLWRTPKKSHGIYYCRTSVLQDIFEQEVL